MATRLWTVRKPRGLRFSVWMMPLIPSAALGHAGRRAGDLPIPLNPDRRGSFFISWIFDRPHPATPPIEVSLRGRRAGLLHDGSQCVLVLERLARSARRQRWSKLLQ